MARYELKTFKDIIDAVCETVKIQSSDLVSRNRIRRNINSVYLDEVVPYKQWPWLRGFANLQIEPYFGTGTATVSASSVAVTLSETPVKSYKGYYFAVDGFNEVYKIAFHTAGSTSLILEVPYGSQSTTTAKFKIWKDAIALPTDCKETLEISHQFDSRPLENVGLQEFRRLAALNNKAEGRPRYYTTTDYRDPQPYSAITGLPATTFRSSAGIVKSIVFASGVSNYLEVGDRIEVSGGGQFTYNGEFIVSAITTTTAPNDTVIFSGRIEHQESSTADAAFTIKALNSEGYERFREFLVFPSLFNARTSLHVDYIRQVVPLEDDLDEPLMNMEDRMVLYYGAIWLTWQRERNPEEAAQAFQLFQRKLDRMAGKTEDSPDKPILMPSKMYLSTKRLPARARSISGTANMFGGGSTASPIGSPNKVAIYNNEGNLVSSPGVTTTELNFIDGVLSQVLGESDTGTFTNKTIDGDDNTITDIGIASIKADAGAPLTFLSRDGSGVVISTKAVPTGTVVGTSDTQTLTGKTIDGDDNTLQDLSITSIKTELGDANEVFLRDNSGVATSALLVNANVDSAAAIARSKLASGTNYRIVANNSSGVMAENAALTSGQLIAADVNGQLADSGLVAADVAAALAPTSVTLTDNTSNQVAISWAVSATTQVTLDYSIKRGTDLECGIIKLITDASAAGIAQGAVATIGSSVGITLTADINSGNLRLLSTSTSTGSDATLKYVARIWLA